MDAEGLDREPSASGRGGIFMVVGVVVAAIAMAMLTVSLAGADTDGTSAESGYVITISGANVQKANNVVGKGVKFTGSCENVENGILTATFVEADRKKLNSFLRSVGKPKVSLDKATPILARTNPPLFCAGDKVVGQGATGTPVRCGDGSCAKLSSQTVKALKVGLKKKNAKKASKKLRSCKVKGKKKKWTCVRLKLTAVMFGAPDGTPDRPRVESSLIEEIHIKPIRMEIK